MYASIHTSIHAVLNTGGVQMEEEGFDVLLPQICAIFINIKCHDIFYVNMSGVELFNQRGRKASESPNKWLVKTFMTHRTLILRLVV